MSEDTSVPASQPDEGADLFKELDQALAQAPQDVSEDDKTPAMAQPAIEPKVGARANDRIRQLIDENKRLKASTSGVNPMEVVRLAKALEGYNENEVDFITRNSGSSKIDDIIKTTKDPWVETAIKARREEEKNKKKVPGSSSPDFATGQRDWRDIQKMKSEDFQKYEQEQLRGNGNL